MKIIQTDQNIYIKVDPQPCEPGYVWGQRWNRNEQRFHSQCMLYKVDRYSLRDEKNLPGPLAPVELKND